MFPAIRKSYTQKEEEQVSNKNCFLLCGYENAKQFTIYKLFVCFCVVVVVAAAAAAAVIVIFVAAAAFCCCLFCFASFFVFCMECFWFKRVWCILRCGRGFCCCCCCWFVCAFVRAYVSACVRARAVYYCCFVVTVAV